MTRTLATLVTCSILAAMAPLTANAQSMPNKLDSDSTPSYQEHATTPPASAALTRDQALKTVPGKVSAGKEPAPTRPNGLGMDAGAGSMSKKN
jgi:hypothetical protein